MSETAHIAELAGKISDEIFSNFLWKKSSGPTDYRWPCELDEKHAKMDKNGETRKSKQHPTDVVFEYSDPYLGKTVYVNCDLKSYSVTTIQQYNPHDDALSLAAAVECANLSPTFQDLYIYEGTPWIVEGLLFIYNHDKEFDRNGQVLFEKAPRMTRIVGTNRIFIMGPKRIADLYSVSRDIDTRIAKLTRQQKFVSRGFRAPDLDITKVKGNIVGSATLEMLTGPWVIHQINTAGGQIEYQLYYLDNAPSPNDFKFLIDGLIHYQLLDDTSVIDICVLDSNEEILTGFVAAKKEYASEYHGITEDSLPLFQKRLERIRCSSVSIVVPPFFELEEALPNE